MFNRIERPRPNYSKNLFSIGTCKNERVGTNMGQVEDGTKLNLGYDNSDYHQIFQFKPTEHGFYEIVNIASGSNLEVENNSIDDNANIQIGKENKKTNQQFKFFVINIQNDQFHLIQCRNSSKFWTIVDDKIVQRNLKGDSSQFFFFEDIEEEKVYKKVLKAVQLVLE